MEPVCLRHPHKLSTVDIGSLLALSTIVHIIMSSSDVRSILDLPSREVNASSSSAQQSAQRRSVNTAKKPDGISRELYALIGDNAPFLAETQAALSATKYRERPKPKIKDARWYAISR